LAVDEAAEEPGSSGRDAAIAALAEIVAVTMPLEDWLGDVRVKAAATGAGGMLAAFLGDDGAALCDGRRAAGAAESVCGALLVL
jgi:hypothetical protein